MATALPGRNSTVAVSTAGVTYTAVGGTKNNIDFSIDGASFDKTTRDDASFTRKMGGRSTLAFSFGGLYAEDDAGQAILRDAAHVPGTLIYFRFREQVGTGKLEWIILGFVKSYKTSTPDDGPITFTVDVDVDGAPTKQAQT